MAGDDDLLADFGKFGLKADTRDNREAGGGFGERRALGRGLKAVAAGDGIGNGKDGRKAALAAGGDFKIGSFAIEAQLDVVIGGEAGAIDGDRGAR